MKAVVDGRKNMDNKPNELLFFVDQVDQISRYMAMMCIEETLWSWLYIKLSILLVLFSKKTIPIQSLKRLLPTQSGHDVSEALDVATTMDDFVASKVICLIIF